LILARLISNQAEKRHVTDGIGMPLQQLRAALLIACVAAPVANTQQVASSKIQAASSSQSGIARVATLRPGDHLKITVISDDKDLSGEFEVAPDSTLRHPLYNRVKVAGVPVTELKDRIATFLRTFQKEPLLDVEPLFEITISGEVNKAGVFFLAPETTMQKAIEQDAIGMNDRANPNAIVLLRDDRRIPIKLAASSAGTETQTIQSGDHIIVGSKRNVVGSITPFVGIGASLISVIVLIASHHR
jgi:protein involved in polysaccharide export with SLBB domain